MAKKQLTRIKTKAHDYWLRFNYIGLMFGVLFFWLSLLPSLMPRPWLFQGIIGGISVAIGYGVGVLVSQAIRWLVQKELPLRYKNNAWRGLYIAAPIVTIIMLVFGAEFQNQVRTLVGEEPIEGYHMIRILILTVGISIVLITLARAIRKINAFLRSKTQRWLPPHVGAALSFGIVTLVLYWLASGVLYKTFVDVSNNIYRNQNNQTPAGVTQPQDSTRSGSPESLIAWDSLGNQGQSFVAGGPNEQQMKAVGQQNPKQQIRIYAGVKSADTPRKRADLVVQEMERTKAFDRKVLIVATPTGTGWLEPQSVDSLEYMYGGDSAIVAQQYSYLPSWISFLVDKENATNAGQALYNAVYAKWSQLPSDKRPKLIVYGLSLGSFGAQSAFTSANDVAISSDGALFMGTPNDTRLWRGITNDRDAGSPEWQPVYEGGQTVRFAATNENIQVNQDTWRAPRILYMQHASDPVVWFSFDLLLNKPAWLSEPRGPDVSTNMNWYPFITFTQVAVDQFFGVSVPNGHGHNYGNTIVDAWQSVTNPPNWSAKQSAQLQDIINAYPID